MFVIIPVVFLNADQNLKLENGDNFSLNTELIPLNDLIKTGNNAYAIMSDFLVGSKGFR